MKAISPIKVNERKGFGFTYKFHRESKLTTSHVVCFVENKRGYTLTYFCLSSLYSHLKPIFNQMLSTFYIIDTDEDRVFTPFLLHSQVIHPITLSNSMSILWNHKQMHGCDVQIPSHWISSNVSFEFASLSLEEQQYVYTEYMLAI